MRRYLVVANRTLGGEHLRAKIRECLAAGPCEFHVLVPASHDPGTMTWTEGHDPALAERRLADALARLAEVGAEASGEVGDPNPVQAISDVLLRERFDEIILSTLPPGVSRWLKADLPHRVERDFNLPVTHVIATEEPAAAT
jgi:hypothetical protein